MIFTLDLYGSTIILASLWLLMIFSAMSGRMVKMGDPEDPHNNLMRPENDVNVCNYNILGVGGTQDNTPEEIECYVKSNIHNQSKTLWKLCTHTLYDILHEARDTQTLNVAVFVADIDGIKRTTLWGDQQADNLKKVLKQSTNEWRKVLHDGHPEDFRSEDHEIKIAVVVQPASDGGTERYNAINWGPEDDVSHGLLDFGESGMANIGFRSHHVNQLRDLNFHMSVVFENSNSDGTYGYVVRRNFMTSDKSFIMGHCFTKGVTIYINDTMGAELPYDPWGAYFVMIFMTSFVVCVALELMAFRRISRTLVAVSLFVSSAVAYAVCGSLVQIPASPVVAGHPTRFSSDVFPVSLLTHELGHTLLMVDHYKVKLSANGSIVSTSLPGPTKPFNCVMVPISVMGAENHVTSLDRAYVNAMWSMKRGRDYVHRSPLTGRDLWTLKADAKAPLINHNDRASTFISDFVSTNEITAETEDNCANQSILPTGITNVRPQSVDALPDDANVSRNETLGNACVTLGELKDLFDRSCYWNENLNKYEPESVCNAVTQKRVQLTGNRRIVHQYMNVLATPLEFLFVAGLSWHFVKLWEKNEVQNLKNIVKGQEDLHYRQLLDWPTIIVIIMYMILVKVKAENVARCVGVEDSIASWVNGAILFLLIPMIPLLVRRAGIADVLGLSVFTSDTTVRKKEGDRWNIRETRERKRIQTKYGVQTVNTNEPRKNLAQPTTELDT